MKYFILIFLFILQFPVNAQDKQVVNTEYNKKYKKSISSKTGSLSTADFVKMKSSLSNELQINFEENKAIVIHYFQYGSNCILAGYNDEDVLGILNNIYGIANSKEKRFKVKNYFVYNSDSLFEPLLKNEESLILDSGFFKETIFTENKNCQGFYLLKYNGEYLIFYGSDYFDEIEAFLTK